MGRLNDYQHQSKVPCIVAILWCDWDSAQSDIGKYVSPYSLLFAWGSMSVWGSAAHGSGLCTYPLLLVLPPYWWLVSREEESVTQLSSLYSRIP